MANKVYENVVLENKIEDILTTSVDLSNYMTVDTSLEEKAGMKKEIHTYKATGDVEDLAEGQGNSGDISVSFDTKEYTVTVTQGRFQYFDEQEMKDPMIVDAGLKGLAQSMVNDFTKKAVAEYEKATLEEKPVAWSFDAITDGIARLKVEDEAGLTLFISPKAKGAFRKALKDDLKYSEGFVRTGYIGSVSGVPVVVSKAVPENKGYMATKEAVTLFVKKGSEIEQVRDADKRNNVVIARKVALVALTDATKVVKFTVGA